MIITLLTDFGTKDYFVGAVKGAILSVDENASIVDITHEIPPQDVRAAAFTIANYYKTFPPETVHLAVVDPGVGSPRRAIIVETGDCFFVAPDNGLLSFVFENERDFRVFEAANDEYFRRPISRTFHGRDVFAPIAAHLSKGVAPEKFGSEIKDFICFETNVPRRISEKEIEAEIVHIDNFGNLVTNLTENDLPENFVLKIDEKPIGKRRNFYAEADGDETFSIVGSAGFLEIVAFCRSAQRLLKAEVGQKIRLTGEGKEAAKIKV